MMKELLPLTEQLRQAILESGQTRYAIAKATGIGQDVLSRFVRGERGLSMESLDKLGLYLGLRIVREGRRPVAKQKTR
jgi:plasmid maintenance system antidote protein VapI